MSLVRDYFTTSTFTAWRKQRDSNGRDDIYILLGSYPCTWTNSGGTKKTEDGREFTPAISIYTKTPDIVRGDSVAVGSFTDLNPPNEAREVMMVETDHPLLGTLDYNIYAN